MKTSFLVTFLLAAAICCTHGLVEVKDSNGNPVKRGVKYFIRPVSTNGGGLVPAAINVLPFCPLGITQTLLPYQPGLPVIFDYWASFIGKDSLFESVDTNIKFESNIWPVCNEFSKLWAVDESSSAREPAIIIGGVDTALNSTFKVEKARGENTYRLTTALYGTVGTAPGVWLGAPQLLATNDAAKTLFVKFVKVDDATTTTTSRVEKLGLRMFPFY